MIDFDPDDDPSIPDEAKLLRRIPPIHFPGDRMTPGRPSSAAFEDSPDGSPMSVNWEELCHEHQFDSLEGHETFGLVSFTAGQARELGLSVFRWPLEGNPTHCGVARKKTKGIKKKLASESRWVVFPHPEVEHPDE